MHIYHYAPYEPAALKRLMGRYGSCEDEIDRMLRSGLFVDLYAAARQAIRAGVERYSIKNLEPLYAFTRDVELKSASRALRTLERALELDAPEAAGDDVREVVRGYNEDDCVSTRRLRDWLEAIRAEQLAKGATIDRPTSSEPVSEEVDERRRPVIELRDALMSDVPTEESLRSRDQHARWLIAQLLEFHRREEKAPWWEYFRLRDATDEDLLAERAAISGLAFIERSAESKRVPIDVYGFPPQDTDLREDADLRTSGGDPFGKLVAIDLRARTVTIRKRGDAAELHPAAVFAHNVVTGTEKARALKRIGEWIQHNGIDAAGRYRAGRDILLRNKPRVLDAELTSGHGATLEAAKTLALSLDDGVLPIQGPPGAGKTFTGARMIVDLVAAGKRVGVTATSHKVIRNLLDGVVQAAADAEVTLRCMQKTKAKPNKDSLVREVTQNKAVVEAVGAGAVDVIGGTSWLWSREDMFEAVDVLFVDEAGQLSLADAVAVSQGAKSVVLLGDPQQLEQPMQGSHPEGSAVSVLEHMLGGAKTIAEDRGLFLAETWRLHPEICKLTSELFYEGRLHSRPGLERQGLVGSAEYSGAGLHFVPVEHEGNRSSSPEEVAVIVELWRDFTSGEVTWTDSDGAEHPLTADDVVVVAPYNAQVSDIALAIPDARVGTVDKFQGQEAPVMIYSMATSTPDDAPRGMEFLYSPNRLNVATSRARCACILVASPRLLEPDCRTPRHMKLANGLCRFVELAEELLRQ